MAVTQGTSVRWEMENASLSEVGSGSTDSFTSTSTFEYINSQLIAHGFIPFPGISLDGIAQSDLERAVKCFLALLSQRVEDMSRTEELSTKYRTLSYDHERILRLHHAAIERAAKAERDMNMHQSRLVAVQRTLQNVEANQKQTIAELQRTRTAVNVIRTAHQAELKKKEKDVDKMAERMSKIADAQTKLVQAPSGMRCANVAVIEGSEVLGKGKGFLEISLEEAENARRQLKDENLHLRKLFLDTVNEIQSILHEAQLVTKNEERIPYNMSTLFPMYPSTLASDKLVTLLSDIRSCLSERLEQPNVPLVTSDAELEKLQNIIVALKEELERTKRNSAIQSEEAQAMFDKFAEDHRIHTDELGEMSVELMSAPMRDDEKMRLDRLRKELDDERKKFTNATVKLGKDKAALDAERVRLLDEKRSWEVEKLLAELPPTPMADSVRPRTHFVPHTDKSSRKSPRKSPTKPIPVGKGSGRKTVRLLRRSLTSPSKYKYFPSYETEVISPLASPSFPPLKPLARSILLSTTFTLPPPSPHSSLPTNPPLPLTLSSPPDVHSAFQESLPSTSIAPLMSSTLHSFPVAKPLAQRMIHAYSPAKPSPLSRILKLANSPTSPNFPGPTSLPLSSSPLEVVSEEKEDRDWEGVLFPTIKVLAPAMSLAAELGVESPPSIYDQHAHADFQNMTVHGGRSTARDRMLHSEANMKKDKGKGKEVTGAGTRLSQGKGLIAEVAREKENSRSKRGEKMSSTVRAGGNTAAIGINEWSKARVKAAKPVALSTLTGKTITSRARVPVKPAGKDGPRRVLINSEEAPLIVKVRKAL